MLEQDKRDKILKLIMQLNPDLDTTLDIIRELVFFQNSKALIHSALDLICQQPSEENEAKVLADLKRSIDAHYDGVKSNCICEPYEKGKLYNPECPLADEHKQVKHD